MDLEKNARIYAGIPEDSHLDLKYCVMDKKAKYDAFIDGANWQKKQDQSTIELAEDHAMLAGMEKMKEQMMKDVVEVCIVSSFGPVLDMPNSHIRGIHCTYEEKESTPALFVGDKVKMIIIKEE